MILSLLTLAFAAAGQAQVTAESAAETTVTTPAASSPTTSSATERSEWLPSFSAVVVDGPVDITFVKAPDTEAPRIVYDTKGSYTTKFQAEVRDKVLYIREKADSRRPERTRVTLSYNELTSLSVTDADAKFPEVLAAQMLDLVVGARAKLTARIEAADLDLNLSGESMANLTGSVRYLTLFASTGSVNATGLECVSAQINAQSKADVHLSVSERLVAKTTTGATVRYKGSPSIVRTSSKFFAGDIKRLE